MVVTKAMIASTYNSPEFTPDFKEAFWPLNLLDKKVYTDGVYQCFKKDPFIAKRFEELYWNLATAEDHDLHCKIRAVAGVIRMHVGEMFRPSSDYEVNLWREGKYVPYPHFSYVSTK